MEILEDAFTTPSGYTFEIKHFVRSIQAMQLARDNGCPWDWRTTQIILRYGTVQVLRWALSTHRRPRIGHDIEMMCSEAADGGNFAMLIWLRKPRSSTTQEPQYKWGADTCANAAHGGHLQCLMWARWMGCPWEGTTLRYARMYAERSGNSEVLLWATEQGCPVEELADDEYFQLDNEYFELEDE
jgi:hypothetical protein